MSDSTQIAGHDEALALYFNEMLVEPNADIVTDKDKARVNKAKPAAEHDKNKPFQALLFDINGLQLAIRTKDIKAILPWPETPLEQRQETSDNAEIMGFYTQTPNQIHIINTALVVFPIQHQKNIAIPSFIIVFGEGHWALSCHKINTVVTLSPEDIQWRKNKGARPWLAGTSIRKSCSIVNLSGLVNLLSPQILA
jgi:purine-binding chemotaxis protein CheW